MKDFIAPIEVNINNCGTIIIRKQTDPNGASGSFGYTSTGGLSPATFSLSDDGVQTYSSVQAGSYTVTENDPTPGFDLTNLTCTASAGSSGTGNVGTRTASITLAAGGTVDCTYTPTGSEERSSSGSRPIRTEQPAPSVTRRQAASRRPRSAFRMTVFERARTWRPARTRSPRTIRRRIRPDRSDLHCDRRLQRDGNTGTRTASITLAAGGTVSCTYTNRQRGTIIIRKQTDPDGAAGTFGYTSTGGLSPRTFSLQDNGSQTFQNLAPGSYSVSENNPAPAFDLTGLTCTATAGSSGTGNTGTRTASITLAAGGTMDCTFHQHATRN